MPLVTAGVGNVLVGLELWFAFSTTPEKFPWLSVWRETLGNKIYDFWVLEPEVIPLGISAGIIIVAMA